MGLESIGQQNAQLVSQKEELEKKLDFSRQGLQLIQDPSFLQTFGRGVASRFSLLFGGIGIVIPIAALVAAVALKMGLGLGLLFVVASFPASWIISGIVGLSIGLIANQARRAIQSIFEDRVKTCQGQILQIDRQLAKV